MQCIESQAMSGSSGLKVKLVGAFTPNTTLILGNRRVGIMETTNKGSCSDENEYFLYSRDFM